MQANSFRVAKRNILWSISRLPYGKLVEATQVACDLFDLLFQSPTDVVSVFLLVLRQPEIWCPSYLFSYLR